jgi:hypothetical protein
MSLEYVLASQGAGYLSLSVSQTAFTVLVRVRINAASPAARSLLSVHTNATPNNVHEIETNAAGTAWTLKTDFGATSTPMQTSESQAQGQWYDIALVGVSSSGTKLRGYVRPLTELTAREYEIANGTSGTINHIHLGSPYVGFQALANYSNLKIWTRALTKSQLETEMASQTVVDTADRVAYNDLIGADVSEVLTSTFGTAPWDEMESLDPGGDPLGTPVRSTAEPSWALADWVVSPVASPIVLPDEAPVATSGIRVVQSALAVSLGNVPSLSATLAAPPGYRSLAVAVLGGWTNNPSDVTVHDTLGLQWTQRVVRQYTPGGDGPHLVMWTAPVLTGFGALSANPVFTGATAPSWVSFALLEVAQADLATLIDGTPVSATGTGTAVTADHANTTNADDMLVAALTYGSSVSSVSSWGGGYTQVADKPGEAALSVATRAVTATGNYDPSATLSVSTPWVAGVMALRQVAETAPSITTTALAGVPLGVAGNVQLEATGSGPIVWTMDPILPDATLTAGGLLFWSVDLAAGPTAFTVTATNSAGADTQALTLTSGSTISGSVGAALSGVTLSAVGVVA